MVMKGSEHNYQRDYWSKTKWNWRCEMLTEAKTHPPDPVDCQIEPLLGIEIGIFVRQTKVAVKQKPHRKSSLLQSKRIEGFLFLSNFFSVFSTPIHFVSIALNWLRRIAPTEYGTTFSRKTVFCGYQIRMTHKTIDSIGGFHAWWFYFLFLNALICWLVFEIKTGQRNSLFRYAIPHTGHGFRLVVWLLVTQSELFH